MHHLVGALLVVGCGVGCGVVKDDRPPIDPPPIESCAPGAFVGCDGDLAQVCNAAGDGAVETDCGAAGCNEGAGRCNLCAPGALVCGAGTVDRCGPDGTPAAIESCPAGCAGAPA